MFTICTKNKNIKRNFILQLSVFFLSALFLFSSSAEASIVQCGDEISFDKAQLNVEESLVTIEWSQDFKTRKATYSEIPAIDKEKEVFPLFVQASMIDNFLSKSNCEDDKCTIKVGKEFQYGQNKAQTDRFLVYQNKLNKPYQHRFVTSNTLTKFANAAEAFSQVENIPISIVNDGLKQFGSIVKLGKSAFGDYLKNC